MPFERNASTVESLARVYANRRAAITEFADDIRNFDVSNIVGIESTILIPSTSSPLR
jgi:hypothetical protein